LTVIFDVEELYLLKRTHPSWVLLLGDKAKNPSRLVGAWKEMTNQSMEELQALVERVQRSEVEAWNFGPRSGLGGLACLDWDWEFLAPHWSKHFGERAKTLTFQTPNMGYRMLYTTTEKENSSPFKRNLHMEFENGGYVAVGGFAEDIEGNKRPYTKVCDAQIRIDNNIIGDTKAFLAQQLERYDFLGFNCVNSVVDRKHIRLDHNQRLALVQFMVSKDFLDDEIQGFFKTVYQTQGKRDYDFGITQAQISSARGFHEKGGRPHPCTAKTNPENGRISTPLFQIFGFDHEKCSGCPRKQKVKDEAKEVKERHLEEVLERLRSEFIFKTPTDLRDLFYYEDGIYKPAQCKIEGLLEKELGARASAHFVCEVLEHLKHGSYVERCEFNKFTGSVPVLNGLLDLTSLELKPFDPNMIFTYKLNVRFDAEAKCPRWLGFLDQILPVEDQPLLQEYLGYCILPAMPKHKIMWFYGLGRNGKGRVIATLEAIVGVENCSYLQLEEFDGEHRFAVASLYGKMVNVSSEPSTVAMLQTPLLKKITGEDTLDAEVKGKQKRLSFRNVAKAFVLGNEFPRVSDTSLAFEDRTLILKFPNSFVGKNQIDNIERSWLENSGEVSGIFNWMLQGLHRLGVNGDFTLSKTTQEVILEFKRTSDPFGAWLEDKCIFDVDGFILRKSSFEDFKNYCDQELGKAPETERRFYQRLRDTPKIKDYESSKGRGFKGIRLKNPDDKPEDQKQTQLTDTPDTTATPDKSIGKKTVSTAKDEFSAAEKVVVPVVTGATEKTNTNKEVLGQKLSGSELEGDKKDPKVAVGELTKTALINNEPIHYHVLAPNQPHRCDKYGCSREAKYQLGDSFYCDDKAISHFREIANKCHQEGFMLIEDLMQLDS
jgi:P4 family phage/plasmid primase-like protien